MNTSFDASKSANTINYVNSAYMSAIPNQVISNAPIGVIPAGSKLSKVGLKQIGATANSRQPQGINNSGNNYNDGSTAGMFMAHGPPPRQTGGVSHSQGPVAAGKNPLYMSQQERMNEIGKVYNYHGAGDGVNAGNTASGNIKISNQRKSQQVSQSLTRAQIKDATKRSATGGTGNITTPNTQQLQTI